MRHMLYNDHYQLSKRVELLDSGLLKCVNSLKCTVKYELIGQICWNRDFLSCLNHLLMPLFSSCGDGSYPVSEAKK